MGVTWISSVIITLQIRALISVKTTVTGVKGQRFDFKCNYEDGQQSNAKYFCYGNDENMSLELLIRSEKHDQWERSGRFSLYDNTTGVFFIIRVDNLTSEDSGTYRCGVDVNLLPDHVSFIHLKVSGVTESPIFPDVPTFDKLHLSLYMTAALCMTALLFVFLFTLCLLAVKRRRPGPRHSQETSSDYETMMPGVTPAPADLMSNFSSKHRESTVSLGLGEYVDIEAPEHICQYQQLELSHLERHIYHSLDGNKEPKAGPLLMENPS